MNGGRIVNLNPEKKNSSIIIPLIPFPFLALEKETFFIFMPST